MLIGHEADRSIDLGEGRPGVLYQRKRDAEGTLEERFAAASRRPTGSPTRSRPIRRAAWLRARRDPAPVTDRPRPERDATLEAAAGARGRPRRGVPSDGSDRGSPTPQGPFTVRVLRPLCTGGPGGVRPADRSRRLHGRPRPTATAPDRRAERRWTRPGGLRADRRRRLARCFTLAIVLTASRSPPPPPARLSAATAGAVGCVAPPAAGSRLRLSASVRAPRPGPRLGRRRRRTRRRLATSRPTGDGASLSRPERASGSVDRGDRLAPGRLARPGPARAAIDATRVLGRRHGPLTRCTSAGTARSALPARTITGASTCASAPRQSGRVPMASAARATPSAPRALAQRARRARPAVLALGVLAARADAGDDEPGDQAGVAQREREAGRGAEADADQDRAAALGGDQAGHVGGEVVDAPRAVRRRRGAVSAQVGGDDAILVRERARASIMLSPVCPRSCSATSGGPSPCGGRRARWRAGERASRRSC